MGEQETPISSTLPDPAHRSLDWLIYVAGFVTVVWVTLAVLFSIIFNSDPPPLWVKQYWGKSSQGETGDYLTGWLTPLALGWFVVTVFLQRRELQYQRQELIRMREEYTEQRHAAQQQARALEASNDVVREHLSLLARQHSADAIWRISSISRDFQLKVIGDPMLTPMLSGKSEITPDDKRALYIGLIINHFALIYDMYSLIGMPLPVWETFVNDMRDFFGSPIVQRRWEVLSPGHRRDFVQFVEDLLAPQTAASPNRPE